MKLLTRDRNEGSAAMNMIMNIRSHRKGEFLA